MSDKNHLLQLMGITPWRLRKQQGDEHYFFCELNNTAGKAVGLIIADIDSKNTLSEQENLLQKIAQALTPHSQCKIIFEISLDAIKKNNYAFIIFLGDKIKKINSDKLNCRVIESFSLIDLSQNVEHKKQLWTEIKLLCDLFKC